MSTITKQLNNILTLIESARRTHADYRSAIASLAPEFAGQTPRAVRVALAPVVAKFYGCTLSASESNNNRGDLTVMNGERAEAARQSLIGIAKDICGTSTAHTDKAREEFKIPADVRAAAEALWALCAQYEKAGSLASQALAAARAK